MKSKSIQSLLDTGNEQYAKLHEIVAQAIDEQKLITSEIGEKPEKIPFPQRLADRVASFGGSWTFIILFFIVLLGWIFVNTYGLLSKPFDPYPFILMNLILSCIAALQAPVIMMSQNRQEEKDRERATNDYLVNLKAEVEIRNLHQKVDLLMSEQIKNLVDIQRVQIEMLEKLAAKLDPHGKGK